MKPIDTTIRTRMIAHIHAEFPTNQPKDMFIPKKLAMRVGGISSNDTSVNTFMILF